MSNGTQNPTPPGWVSEFMDHYRRGNAVAPTPAQKHSPKCDEQKTQDAENAAHDKTFRDTVARYLKTFEGQNTEDAIAKKKVLQDYLDHAASEAAKSRQAPSSSPDGCIPISGIPFLVQNAGITELQKMPSEQKALPSEGRSTPLEILQGNGQKDQTSLLRLPHSGATGQQPTPLSERRQHEDVPKGTCKFEVRPYDGQEPLLPLPGKKLQQLSRVACSI